MPKKVSKKSILPSEIIASKIYHIRNRKVMLDRDLAELYGVETRVLNQAVTRNADRFPNDFMFPLSRDEIEMRPICFFGGINAVIVFQDDFHS